MLFRPQTSPTGQTLNLVDKNVVPGPTRMLYNIVFRKLMMSSLSYTSVGSQLHIAMNLKMKAGAVQQQHIECGRAPPTGSSQQLAAKANEPSGNRCTY